MLELNISKNNNEYNHGYGKYYPRVEYKETLSIDDMAKHMARHNTPFSEGAILGILKDFVNCTREQCLLGNTVKIDNLAIFKCSVEGNGLTLAEGYKMPVAGIGELPKTITADSTQPAVESVKLLAQATGEFTRAELNKDAVFGWTKYAKSVITGIISPATDGGDDNNDGE